MLKRVTSTIETALRVIAAVCLLAMTILVVAQVALRYGVGSVPFFTEEVARYAMIWMALLAASVGVREASHIRVDFVPLVLGAWSPAARRALEAVLDLISVGIFLMLVWYGVDMVAFATTQTSEGLRLPLSYPYAVVPVAFACSALFAIMRLVAGDDPR